MAPHVSFNKTRNKHIRIIYIFYWMLLAYIVAALVFWFIALNTQNIELSRYRLEVLQKNDINFVEKEKAILNERSRKSTQYLGEGITFFLFIAAGAVFVFRIIKKQLVQSQQQQNFMIAITHELKTPIAVTKLNLETLQKRKLEPDQQKKLIRTTIHEANRLNSLCNNILLLSQIDSGGYSFSKEWFDLSLLAQNCIADFKLLFPQRIIRSEVEEEIFITGDKLLLQLAINNLLDNAIKYSSKESVVLLKLFKDNKLIRLQVADEGEGVEPSERKKIFEKYFRGARRQAKGTGLGLYLTREIVKQHAGVINLANNIPHGCVFEIDLKLKV